MIFVVVASAVIAACWGSFLNSIAYRLLYARPILTARSYCTRCFKTIAWNDLIPVFSWLWLGGTCRRCRAPISWIYPAVELISALIFPFLFLAHPFGTFCAYSLFVSLLLISFHTDARAFILLRPCTIFAVPTGLIVAALKLIPLSLVQSVLGAGLGFSSLALVRVLYRKLRGFDGLGDGDPELLAYIGAWLGPTGCFFTLMLGSILGAVCGLIQCARSRQLSLQAKLPFGPFLVVAALVWLIFDRSLNLSHLWYHLG